MRTVWQALRMAMAMWMLLAFMRVWPFGGARIATAVEMILVEVRLQQRLILLRMGLRP